MRTTRGVRRLAVLLLIVIGLGAAAVAMLEVPYRGFEHETFLRFERGAGTPPMARALEQAGVIRHRWLFWVQRALHPSAKLQAGEYRFAAPASVREIYNRIARGDIFYLEISIPEGSNVFDIARILEGSGVAVTADDFLRAAANPRLIHDLDPAARTLEGYLFPATYRVTRSASAEELCQMMTAQFRP